MCARQGIRWRLFFFVFQLIYLIIFNINIVVDKEEEEDILCNELTILRLINNITAHNSSKTNRILNIHYFINFALKAKNHQECVHNK